MNPKLKQSELKGIIILNWGVPDEEDAEVEAVIGDRTVRIHGKQAWEIVNRRNMALSMLGMASKAKLREGVDLDDIVVPYALKQAKEILAILGRPDENSLKGRSSD